MPKKPWSFALRVRGVTPQTMPLARLADYLREFGELLGNKEHVHFAGIVKGSAVLRAVVDDIAVTDSTKRLLAARSGDAPKDTLDHAEKIDRMMREDRACGDIIRHDGNVVYAFEGAKRKAPDVPELIVSQEGEIFGVVTRIGGRDETVPLLLAGADGNFYEVNVKGREQARAIATYLFGKPIRVFGQGTWKRTSEGVWKLTSFMVHGFDEADDRPLADVVNELRAISGNGWAKLDDPVGEWERLRGG